MKPCHKSLLAALVTCCWATVQGSVVNAATPTATGAAVPGSEESDVPASSASSATPADAKQLGAIAVTSQSRNQQVQSVPISVQVVTAEQLDAHTATNLADMNGFIPGLNIVANQPTQPVFSIRGIFSADFGIGTDSPIGIYEDGVYQGKTGAALLNLVDVQRVEVLKGPQGTLFGRNSVGGAISIITNEPSDHLEASARTRIGEYGTRYGEGLLNLPLGKTVALRISAIDNQSDGWARDAATGRHYDKNDDWSTRTQLRWSPDSDTKIILGWEHEHLNQPSAAAIGLAPLTTDDAAPEFPANPADYRNPLHASIYNDVTDSQEKRTYDSGNLRITHDFGWGTLSSTSAWKHFSTMNLEDNDGTNNPNTYLATTNAESNTSWYQELKLSGSSDLADWLVGASYYQETAHQTSEIDTNTNSLDTLYANLGYGNLFTDVDEALSSFGVPYHLLGDSWKESVTNTGHYKSFAVYSDIIWHLSDQWDLTTGVRVTRDEKRFSWYAPERSAPALDQTLDALSSLGILSVIEAAGVPGSIFYGNIEYNLPNATVSAYQEAHSWNNVSPRATLTYKFSPNAMAYASFTEGYLAGGYNGQQESMYAPEHVKNYEIGIKSYLPDWHLLMNASLYYYTYTNLQSLVLTTDASTGVSEYTVSSSDQKATGLDSELHWMATRNLRFDFVANYIDATYTKYLTEEGVSLAGQPVGEPLWSASAGVDYRLHHVYGGDMDFNLQYSRRGKTRCNDDSVNQGTCLSAGSFTEGVAQSLTDARISWDSENGHWGVSLYATNLFNHRYISTISNVSESIFGTPFAYITPPRVWGVELRANL